MYILYLWLFLINNLKFVPLNGPFLIFFVAKDGETLYSQQK